MSVLIYKCGVIYTLRSLSAEYKKPTHYCDILQFCCVSIFDIVRVKLPNLIFYLIYPIVNYTIAQVP